MVHRHAIPKQKPIAWQPSTGNRGHEVSTKWFLSLERRDNVAKMLILFFGHASQALDNPEPLIKSHQRWDFFTQERESDRQ
jgi:hypothetical protein